MFEKINSKVVAVDIGMAGGVVARTGGMLFYTGDVSFAPHQIPGGAGMGGGGGILQMAGRMMAGEHQRTMIAQGSGRVHYGFAGLEVHVVGVQPGGPKRYPARSRQRPAVRTSRQAAWYSWTATFSGL